MHEAVRRILSSILDTLVVGNTLRAEAFAASVQ